MTYTAIFKLKELLEENNIPYLSFADTMWKNPYTGDKGYQLILNNDVDAIQHYGSYGESQDLIEIMGGLTSEEQEHNSVLGYLTAEEVFKRFKYCYENNTNTYAEVAGREV